MKGSLSLRLWARVDTSGPHWLWRGATTGGYGRIWVNGQQHYTHRVAYELEVGPIPEGMDVDHLCRVTLCVRPSHLEAVTPTVNKSRVPVRGFCPQGHPKSGANLYINPNTRRKACRICQNAAQKRYHARLAG